MLSLPLVDRELRVQSRQRGTYDMRLLWGLGAVAVLALLIRYFPDQSANGRTIYAVVHGFAAIMLLVVAPLGAADSISQEKREGTLGLLMLTELTPTQVVLAKLATHLIRLFYFSLMLFPFMLIPMLMGGIDLRDILLSISLLFTIAAAGVAAGLIASSFSVRFATATTWAVICTVFLAWLNSTAIANALFYTFRIPRPLDGIAFYQLFIFGPGMLISPTLARDVSSFLIIARQWEFLAATGLLGISLFWLRSAIRLGARRVANHAASESRRTIAARRRLFTPIVWRGGLKRSLAKKLNRNPLIWLEFRTAMRRATRWILAGLVICAETFLLITQPNQQEFIGAHFMMLFVFVLFLAFKSCGSFQEEKESGGFELLLVTPLTEERLLSARLRAVASYYSLALECLVVFGALGLSWAQASAYAESDPLSAAVNFMSIVASIVSTPICGLYFSLRSRSFMSALGWTVGVAILAPLGVWCAVNGLLWMARSNMQPKWALDLYSIMQDHLWPVLLAMALYHLIVATHCYRATLSLLRARQFVARG